MGKERYNYIDGKIVKKIMRSLELNGVWMHVAFTRVLHAIRSNNTDITMTQLYKIAEHQAREDVFLEWAELYTPFRYSRKKKRMVVREKARWGLKAAFENPSFTDEDVLGSELESYKVYNGVREGQAVYLEDFEEYLEDKWEKLDREIDAAVAKRKAKALPCDSLNDEVMVSLTESDKDVIKKYLQRNPAPDTIGPMGTPQSKYRNGTFGLASMEYDAWSRS